MTERKRHSTTSASTRVGSNERVFGVGDRVAWRAEGFPAVQGVVDSLSPDHKFVVVKTDFGKFLTWPTGDARLRYAQTPGYDSDSETTSEDVFDQTLPDGLKTKGTR